MTNKVGKNALLLTLIFFGVLPVLAGGHVSTAQQVSPHSVLIINTDNEDATFELRDERGNWRAMTLGPGKQDTYDDTSATAIRISTNGRPSVVYSLKGGNRYQIVWNGNERQLEVEKITLKKLASAK
jgi:hypothetical protein